ncbi:unnamed protein product [Moneuplotes crassus]|uniref:Uncharacterized protein n=1 Tax=Euplotes crassus TaxID=5936 RepID=A0AAD1Y1T9_EUPCR|nr:unnamed protein product [Moneuplotes crassus]
MGKPLSKQVTKKIPRRPPKTVKSTKASKKAEKSDGSNVWLKYWLFYGGTGAFSGGYHGESDKGDQENKEKISGSKNSRIVDIGYDKGDGGGG